MPMVMVEEGHIVHAVAMQDEVFWLAWGDLPVGYEDPWGLADTPPLSNTKTVTESITKGVLDGVDSLEQFTLVLLMSGAMASVTQGATTYFEGVDYNILPEGAVDWLPGGKEPTSGSVYTVKYRYLTDDIKTIAQERGRRIATQVAYVAADENGSIIANGNRYTVVTEAQAEVTEVTCVTNVPAPGQLDLSSRILITSEVGYANNIDIIIQDTGVETMNGASVTFEFNLLTVEINSGVTTEGAIATALATDSHIDITVADTPSLAWTLGTGNDTGTIVGSTGYSGGESFKFWDTNGVGYYVWVTSDGSGVDPAHMNATPVPVLLLSTDTSTEVAIKIATQLDLLSQFSVPVPLTNVFIMTAEVADSQENAVDVDMLLTFSITNIGTTFPTKNLYVQFKFLAEEASEIDIYQIALCLNTTRTVSTPEHYEYLIPSEVLDPGQMYMVENISPFPRAPGKREVFEFVIVF